MADSLMSKASAYRIACKHRDEASGPGVRQYWETVIDRMVKGK